MREAVVHVKAISTADCYQVARHERLGFIHTFSIDAFAFGDRFGKSFRRQGPYGGLPIQFLCDGQLPVGNESPSDPIGIPGLHCFKQPCDNRQRLFGRIDFFIGGWRLLSREYRKKDR